MKRLTATFMTLLALSTTVPLEAREISKSGQIYEQVKNGVVTVISASHGSGFLVDPSGLIITNSHVVNEAGENLKVRFGPGKVVKATVIENDRVTDVAVIQVNLENIPDPHPLSLFEPPASEPLVLTGEKVLAIGSPVEWETMEKTVTEGIVSKYDNEVIRHDASLNGGNSGGPLFNFDGQVVGINTFIESDRGPAISGTIPITKALPVLSKAKLSVKDKALPKGTLLPDAPAIAYPASVLSSIPVDPNFTSNQRAYQLKGLYYDIQVDTPVKAYHQLQQNEKEVTKNRQRRLGNHGLAMGDDERTSMNMTKYYDYKKPVVTVWVHPKPMQTISSALAQGLVAGFGGYAAAASIPSTYIFRKDFIGLTLVNAETEKEVCEPYLTGRLPYTVDFAKYFGYGTIRMQDKSYLGKYEFDPKCFDSTLPLAFKVLSEGESKEKTYTISNKLKQLISTDFNPYWSYVKSINNEKQALDTVPNNKVQTATDSTSAVEKK